MAAKKKAAKAAAKEKGASRSKFGEDVVITSMPDENWRREGSGNYDRVRELMAYWKKHKDATVRELLDNTSYRRQDYEWDIDREFNDKPIFKTKKAGRPAKTSGAPAEAQASA